MGTGHGDIIKCGATQSGRGQWCKSLPKTEQKIIEYIAREQQSGQQGRD